MTGYYRTLVRPRQHRPLSMLKYDPVGTFFLSLLFVPSFFLDLRPSCFPARDTFWSLSCFRFVLLWEFCCSFSALRFLLRIWMLCDGRNGRGERRRSRKEEGEATDADTDAEERTGKAGTKDGF